MGQYPSGRLLISSLCPISSHYWYIWAVVKVVKKIDFHNFFYKIQMICNCQYIFLLVHVFLSVRLSLYLLTIYCAPMHSLSMYHSFLALESIYIYYIVYQYIMKLYQRFDLCKYSILGNGNLYFLYSFADLASNLWIF